MCVPKLVSVLDRLKAREVTQDYTYYGLASPWLQVHPARLLQRIVLIVIGLSRLAVLGLERGLRC